MALLYMSKISDSDQVPLCSKRVLIMLLHEHGRSENARLPTKVFNPIPIPFAADVIWIEEEGEDAVA